MPTLIINPRSKNLKKIKCDTDNNTKVGDIVREFSRVNKIDPNRVRLSYVTEDANDTDLKSDKEKKSKAKSGRVTMKNEKTLTENGITFTKEVDSITVYAKDVGPQIGWRTVYFIEYLGPVIIQSLFYFLYYTPMNNSKIQLISYLMTILHYLKREMETLLVHSFSSDTMPLKYLFRNCGHYWIFSGLLIGYSIYAPESQATNMDPFASVSSFVHYVAHRDEYLTAALVALFATFELCNFYCHWILKELRSDGSREHRIPYGFAFEFVSFPNYFFEILSWLTFAILNNNWSSWLFFAVGAVTMTNWALGKHKRYLKEFGDKYPKNRKAIIPFIL